MLLIVSHTQHSFTWHTCRLSGSVISRVSKVTAHRFSSKGRVWDDSSTETSVFTAPSQSKLAGGEGGGGDPANITINFTI